MDEVQLNAMFNDEIHELIGAMNCDLSVQLNAMFNDEIHELIGAMNCDLSEEQIVALRQFVANAGGIENALEAMNQLTRKAA